MSDDTADLDKEMGEAVEESIKESKPAPLRRRIYTRRAGDRQGSSASIWLVTFTDVMALMLTFFVLLFSMSDINKESWDKLTQAAQENFNKFEGRAFNRGTQDSININKVNFSRALDLNYLQAIISNMMEKETALKNIEMIPNGNNLIISLPQNLLFKSGEAEVTEAGNIALFTLAGTLSRIKNRIEVVGHTDPRPVTGQTFNSNWELSLSRAANVAGVLENVGYTRPITIRGHASGRYNDLPETMSEQDRLSLSRRVDVVVMEDDGKRLQLFDMGLPSLR